MARRWLLGMLAGVGLTFGVAAGASAQELDPVEVSTDVVDVAVTADTAERSVEVTGATDAEVPEADTEVSPTVTAGVSPAGASLDVEGPVEVVGNEAPVPAASDPVEEAVGGTSDGAGDGGTEAAPVVPSQRAAGGGVTPAAAPEPAGPAPVTTASSPARSPYLSADHAAARSGFSVTSSVFTADADLAPLVAPPDDALTLVAAARPPAPSTTDLAVPFIDTTPTVPGVLRLLAGVMVVGAALTWRTVRAELA